MQVSLNLYKEPEEFTTLVQDQAPNDFYVHMMGDCMYGTCKFYKLCWMLFNPRHNVFI